MPPRGVERVTRPRSDVDPRVVEATEQQEAEASTVRKTLEPDPWPPPHLALA